jgi:hypothetical protein
MLLYAGKGAQAGACQHTVGENPHREESKRTGGYRPRDVVVKHAQLQAANVAQLRR